MRKQIYKFQDDLTVFLENPKIRVFSEILRKKNHLNICDWQTF